MAERDRKVWVIRGGGVAPPISIAEIPRPAGREKKEGRDWDGILFWRCACSHGSGFPPWVWSLSL